MKGMQGIVIAIGLGAVAAFCNWYYVAKQAAGYKTVSFLIIDPQTQLNRGDRFKPEHFKSVAVPVAHVGDLDKSAVLYADRNTIVGQAATRSYRGGELILQQDAKTPSTRDLTSLLSKDEIAFPVPVDPRTFVAENFNPGDSIAFFVPQYVAAGTPTPANTGSDTSQRPEKLIGPFRILALGGRKSTREVEDAFGKSAREDVLTVAVTLKGGEFDATGKALVTMVANTGMKGASVIKLPEKK